MFSKLLHQYSQSKLAFNELISNSNDRQNAIRELIVGHPDIWHKACVGEPLDPTSRLIAAKIFDAYTDNVFADYILYGEGLVQSNDASQKIVEEIAAQMWVYPGLRDLFKSRNNWHQGAVITRGNTGLLEGLGERILASLKELESSDVEPEMDTAWCART